jgi:hypothetical protein
MMTINDSCDMKLYDMIFGIFSHMGISDIWENMSKISGGGGAAYIGQMRSIFGLLDLMATAFLLP